MASTNKDLAEALESQNEKIEEMANAVQALVGIATEQMKAFAPESSEDGKDKGKGTPENALIAKMAEVGKTAARDALREAREDLAFYEKPMFKIAVGVTAVGVGGYFLHKAVKQSGVAHATSQRNSATIGLLGLEPDGDGGIIATGLSGIGKK